MPSKVMRRLVVASPARAHTQRKRRTRRRPSAGRAPAAATWRAAAQLRSQQRHWPRGAAQRAERRIASGARPGRRLGMRRAGGAASGLAVCSWRRSAPDGQGMGGTAGEPLRRWVFSVDGPAMRSRRRCGRCVAPRRWGGAVGSMPSLNPCSRVLPLVLLCGARHFDLVADVLRWALEERLVGGVESCFWQSSRDL